MVNTASCSTAANVKVCKVDRSYNDLTFMEAVKQNQMVQVKTN